MMIAFYKGKGSIYNLLVRWWTRGPFSHVELVFSTGTAASSSFRDGGVRFKQIDFDSGHWTLVAVPRAWEPSAAEWFAAHRGWGYDLLGNLRFLFGALADDRRKVFCSEAVAAALGIPDPWRFDPNTLHAVITRMIKEHPPVAA